MQHRVKGMRTREEMIEEVVGDRGLVKLEWHPFIYNDLCVEDVEDWNELVNYTFKIKI